MAKKGQVKRIHMLLQQRENLSQTKRKEPGTIPNSIPNKLIQFFVQTFGFTSMNGGFLFAENYLLKGFSYFSSHFEKAASS